MALLAPERERTERRVRHEPPPRRSGGGLVAAFVLGLAAAGLLWLGAGLLPSLGDLFGDKAVDRSQPALLKSLEELREYRAASGNFEIVVDLEKDTNNVPSFLKGERTLFVAAGSVDAGIDFRGLPEDAVDISADRRTATVTLPHAKLFEARVDPGRSYVFERERGLLDRVGSAFIDNPSNERELFMLAERKLAAAAAGPSGLVPAAERNTRAMVESLLRRLGFERVDVRFR